MWEGKHMDHKKEIQKQFGKNADSYVTSPIHRDGKDLQKLLDLADINGSENVLDIATGGGHTANCFAPFVKKVTALDLTAEMLAAAHKFINRNGHFNVEVIQGDAENLPFATGTFDIVTCRIAPHHFSNVHIFVNETYRVLKSGGQFLLIDNVAPEDDELDEFYNYIEKKRDHSHYRAWKKSEWLKMLELAGFEINQWHRFEKTFQFESWCNQMKLPIPAKEELTRYIINASDKAKDKFRIIANKQAVTSFQGESIILSALKR
jgi:ubiquinone/menaquinone biosynthesis C-methylase UbiE